MWTQPGPLLVQVFLLGVLRTVSRRSAASAFSGVSGGWYSRCSPCQLMAASCPGPAWPPSPLAQSAASFAPVPALGPWVCDTGGPGPRRPLGIRPSPPPNPAQLFINSSRSWLCPGPLQPLLCPICRPDPARARSPGPPLALPMSPSLPPPRLPCPFQACLSPCSLQARPDTLPSAGLPTRVPPPPWGAPTQNLPAFPSSGPQPAQDP